MMTGSAVNLFSLMLAEGRLSEISRSFEDVPVNRHLTMLAFLGIAAVVLTPVAIVLGMKIYNYWNDPEQRAWRRITAALQLAWPDRKLLLMMARHSDIKPAAALLISRGAYRVASQAFLADEQTGNNLATKINDLQERLFSE